MEVADSFGRLPVDVLKSITNLFELPTIDIVETSSQIIEMQIKYLMLETKIRMILSLINYVDKRTYYNGDSNNIIIKAFIDDLNSNKNTRYGEYCDSYNENFNIKVKDNTIKITTNNSTIILTIESKDQLIKAMNKYYDILNEYPIEYPMEEISNNFL